MKNVGYLLKYLVYAFGFGTKVKNSFVCYGNKVIFKNHLGFCLPLALSLSSHVEF
jgi:hypothetical protein